MIRLSTKNRLLAHSDAHYSYTWRLYDQFDKNHKLFKELEKNYTIDIDYFQTTIMLYSTDIIEENTFKELYDLTLKYPISITNDQGIIALYFTNVKNVWRQIQTKNEHTSFYDYLEINPDIKFIMKKVI